MQLCNTRNAVAAVLALSRQSSDGAAATAVRSIVIGGRQSADGIAEFYYLDPVVGELVSTDAPAAFTEDTRQRVARIVAPAGPGAALQYTLHYIELAESVPPGAE
jgi:hypothetical protein